MGIFTDIWNGIDKNCDHLAVNVIGGIIVFVLIGFMIWFVRKYFIGQTKDGSNDDQNKNKDFVVMKNVSVSPVVQANNEGGGDQTIPIVAPQPEKGVKPAIEPTQDGGQEDQGDSKNALKLYKKVLAIFEKVLGKKHPNTAVTYHNMANVYKEQGDYKNALKWYKKALAIKEKVLGKEHPDTAATYHNMADVYRTQGDLKEALEWYGKALAIVEKMLSKKHPDTAVTYNNMACVYREQGDLEEALVWHGKALRIDCKVWGPNHPHCRMSIASAIITHRRAGRKESFERWLEATLAGE